MRARTAWLLAALLIAGVGAFATPPVAAAPAPPECEPGTTQDHTRRARAVLVGTPTSVEREAKEGSERGATYTHEVSVERVYKGSVETEVVSVVTEQEPSSCEVGPLTVDEAYVLFVQPDDESEGVWRAVADSGTAPADERLLAQVERLLGPGREPTPPEPDTATFTPVDVAEPMTLTRAAAPGLALVILGFLGLFVVGRLAARRGG